MPGAGEQSLFTQVLFFIKVTIGVPLEGGGWAGSRQAAAGADQESCPVPGAVRQSHFTQVLNH